MKKNTMVWIGAGSLLVVAALLLWRRPKKNGYAGEKPPKRAPQLHIEHPGSQDEFPKPPIESDLG